MNSSAVDLYVNLIEIALTIAIVADIVLGVVVYKKHIFVKPLYPSSEKNQIKKAIAIRATFYFVMMWALVDRNLGVSDSGYIVVIYIAVLLKGFYDVKYGTQEDEESGAL